MSWLDGLRHRMRVHLAPREYAREQEDELRAHLELGAAESAHQGEDLTNANATARRQLGNLTGVKEDLRRESGFAWTDRIHQDLSYAVRGLLRSPGFTITVVLTIALGVGANAAIFSFLDRLFLRAPDGVATPAGLRRLYIQDHDYRDPSKTRVFPHFNYPGYAAVRGAANDTNAVTAFTAPDRVTIGRGDAATDAMASWVSPEYFGALSVRFARGRAFAAGESRIDIPARIAVITDALWQRTFDRDSAIVGKDVEIDRAHYTIVGVTAPGFVGLNVDATDLFLPLSTFPVPLERGIPWFRESGNYLTVAARLPNAADERDLLRRGSVAYDRMPQIAGYHFDTASAILAGPIVEARGPGEQTKEVSIGLRVAGVALLVLCIACANVANLLLVRATQRRREIAIRLAIGVSRARLFAQFLTESVLLAIISSAGALVVAWWGGTLLRRLLLPATHWATGALDARLVAFTGGAAVLVGIVAGLAPVAFARNHDVVHALKGGSRDGAYRRSRLRTSLLVAQTTLSVVLVAGAGLCVRSLGNVNAIRIGYDADSLVFATVGFDDAMRNPTEIDVAITQLATRMKGETGVLAIAYSSSEPMRGWTQFRLDLPGHDSLPKLSGEHPYPMMNWVSPNFFGTVGTRIIAGRRFADDEPGGTVVVNETMAKTFWPGEDAVGKCLLMDGPKGSCRTVIGIAENARATSVIEDPSMQFFLSRGLANTLIIRVDPENWAVVAARARTELTQLLPNLQSVAVTRMRDRLDRQIRPWRTGAWLFTVFGLLALAVAALGVYSVISYSVSQRTQEMGVRVALGARVADVLRLVAGEGLRVVAVGVVLGIGIAMAAGKLIASLLYGVTPRDPLVMVGVAIVLFAVGIIASLVPAWRASRVDPITALRAD